MGDVEIRQPFTDAYELVRTVDLDASMREFRIEILRTFKGQADPFIATHYERVDGVWRERLSVGFVSGADADDTLRQAVSRLRMAIESGKIDEE